MMIFNGAQNMKWEAFLARLNLDKVQAHEIESILNCYKDQYTALCLRSSKGSGKSPIEYAAGLQITSPNIGKEEFGRKFVNFLSKEKESVSNLSFVEIGLQYDLSVREKINKILRYEQERHFGDLGINSMLEIITDYDPFGEKLTEQIVTEQELHMERKGNYSFSKTFCILPRIHYLVKRNGEVKLCCFSSEGLTDASVSPPFSLKNYNFRRI